MKVPCLHQPVATSRRVVALSFTAPLTNSTKCLTVSSTIHAGREVDRTARADFVEDRSAAVAILKLVEQDLLHTIVLTLRHTSVPEPHGAFLSEGLDQVLFAVEMGRKAVRHAPGSDVRE